MNIKPLYAIGAATVLSLTPHPSGAGQVDLTKELKQCSVEYMGKVAPSSAFEASDTKDGFIVRTTSKNRSDPYINITHSQAQGPETVNLNQIIDGESSRSNYDHGKHSLYYGLSGLILKQAIEEDFLQGIESEEDKKQLLKDVNEHTKVVTHFTECMNEKQKNTSRKKNNFTP